MLQCPHCPEGRPSRSRLDNHVMMVHPIEYRTSPQGDRLTELCTAAIPNGAGTLYPCPQVDGHDDDCGPIGSSPRWPNPAALAAAGRPVLRIAPSASLPVPEQVTEDGAACCTCGSRVTLVTDDDGTSLRHAFSGRNGCTDARLDSQEPTPQDRAQLQASWDEGTARFAKAAEEMAELRASLDAVDATMQRMDAELTKPSVVRRATLNQVWDRLLDAGHLAAAREVMKMIERVVD